MDLHDPSPDDEALMQRVLMRVTDRDARLSEVEIAWDLQPLDPKAVMGLKRSVLAHLLLPYARTGALPPEFAAWN